MDCENSVDSLNSINSLESENSLDSLESFDSENSFDGFDKLIVWIIWIFRTNIQLPKVKWLTIYIKNKCTHMTPLSLSTLADGATDQKKVN